MGQQQSSDSNVCAHEACAREGGNTTSAASFTPEAPAAAPTGPTVRVHCLEAVPQAMEKLRALLEATPNAYCDAGERRLRHVGLARLARSFTVSRDTTVGQLKALVLSNGTGESTADSTTTAPHARVNTGTLSLFALPRPLPERMQSVRGERANPLQRGEADDAEADEGSARVPFVSVSVELTDLVALPNGLPLHSFMSSDQFLTDLDVDTDAADAAAPAGTHEPTLTFFYREESVFGKIVYWTPCHLCIGCFTCCCCCSSFTGRDERGREVHVRFHVGPHPRSTVPTHQPTAVGTVLANEVPPKNQQPQHTYYPQEAPDGHGPGSKPTNPPLYSGNKGAY